MEAANTNNEDNKILLFDSNGILVKIIPDLPLDNYSARFYIINEKKYDLHDIEDINLLPVLSPSYPSDAFSDITKMFEYHLRMKAGDLWQRKLFDEAIACYRKANTMMFESYVFWREEDFMRVVWCMIEAGRFDEAHTERNYIELNYKSKYDYKILHNKCIDKVLLECKKFDTDLIEIGEAGSVIGPKEAVYRNRVYSISGKDKRFPRFIDDIRNSTLIPYPFLEGIYKPQIIKLYDWISYSNRPFVDDRTADEIAKYKNWIVQQETKKKLEITREEYYRLYYDLPEFVPKSLNAYSRMKNAGTDKFWELVEKAADNGIMIEI